MPMMTMLELVRYRQFIDIRFAAQTIGVSEKALRRWELRRQNPRSTQRTKLEATFGLPWSTLISQAPLYIQGDSE